MNVKTSGIVIKDFSSEQEAMRINLDFDEDLKNLPTQIHCEIVDSDGDTIQEINLTEKQLNVLWEQGKNLFNQD